MRILIKKNTRKPIQLDSNKCILVEELVVPAGCMASTKRIALVFAAVFVDSMEHMMPIAAADENCYRLTSIDPSHTC
jgi:hypothetical protein